MSLTWRKERDHMVKPHASVKPKKSRDKFFGIREEGNDRWREVGGKVKPKGSRLPWQRETGSRADVISWSTYFVTGR